MPVPIRRPSRRASHKPGWPSSSTSAATCPAASPPSTTASDQGTGIYIVVATTARGRVLEGVGSELHLNDFLAELSSAETIVDVQRHEMTSAEPIEFGPIYDSPGTSEEDDERPLDEDEYEYE